MISGQRHILRVELRQRITSKKSRTDAKFPSHHLHESGLKSYTCELCEKTFSRMQTLQNHIRAAHDQAKEHYCNLCDKQFDLRKI